VFEGPELYHGITVWLAIIAYAGQIYYDFSGYTDIAIGVAKTLGYRFPRNFRHPYLATSITVFWRRWHMTLSRWLRDYVYISLGGNQHGFRRTLTNLLITMVLGGLWHGAAWTFVLWGAWHGLLLITHRVWRQSVGKTIPIAIRWSLTFLAVAFGWILFRSQSLEHATIVFVRLFRVDDGVLWIPPLAVAAVFIALIEHILWATKGRRMMSLPADRWYSPVATAIFVWCLLLYAPRNFAPFVYFQF
ncbi:MAG: MBOAT family O-acyltransferase, partial [Planctomycetota bacterium]